MVLWSLDKSWYVDQWCINKPLSSSVTPYNNTSIPHKYHTHIYPTLKNCITKSLQVKVLWRSTIADGSGHRIFNLSREAYPKDIPATWKPGSFDKDLPVPGLDPFAHHPHRQTLVKIVSDQTVRVEKELKSLPQRTTAERNYKATMTADLNKLQACKKQVLEGFAEIDKREKDTEEALKTRREELRASGKLPRRTMKGTSKGGTSKGLSGKIGDQSRLEEGNVKEEKDAGEAKAQGEQEKRTEQEEGKEQDGAGPGEEKKD